MSMSPRWRVALALIGLALVVLGIVALAYALWPLDNVLDQQRLPPTLFAPPESLVLLVRLG